jgi:hypothetical protein
MLAVSGFAPKLNLLLFETLIVIGSAISRAKLKDVLVIVFYFRGGLVLTVNEVDSMADELMVPGTLRIDIC